MGVLVRGFFTTANIINLNCLIAFPLGLEKPQDVIIKSGMSVTMEITTIFKVDFYKAVDQLFEAIPNIQGYQTIGIQIVVAAGQYR